jgi:hypothetical protein
MLTAIVLNLVAIIVLVGGWALAVLALYRGLGDPYLPQEDQRLSGVSSRPAAEPARVTVLAGNHAA